MQITFDQAKRDKTFADRGLDFADATAVFEGVTLELDDKRRDYGERRVICYGYLARSPGRHRIYPAWHGSPRF